MQRIDKIVIKETAYIAAWVLIFSAITESVFLIIGQWDYTVLLGNLLGGAIAVLNFFVMGCVVQSAIGKSAKEIKRRVRASMGLRLLLTAGVVALGVLMPVFNNWTVILPIFFPRVAILIRPLWDKGLKTAPSPVVTQSEPVNTEEEEEDDEG